MRFRALLLAVLAGLMVSGCGSGDDGAAALVKEREETLDKLPKLERGYEEHVNAEAGIAFGRPPGWSAKDSGVVTSLTAPDQLVSAAITVDRTDDALGGDPKAFAAETAELLPGYEKPLNPGKAQPFAHSYEGAVVEAK